MPGLNETVDEEDLTQCPVCSKCSTNVDSCYIYYFYCLAPDDGLFKVP